MVGKNKSVVGARGAAAVKAIQAAEALAVKAHAEWAKSIAAAVAVTDKEYAAVAKKTAALKARAAKALARVKNARGPAAKLKARDARKQVQGELAAAAADLTTLRSSQAAAQADAKLFKLIDKALTGAMKAAEKLAAKAAKPKKRRRAKKPL